MKGGWRKQAIIYLREIVFGLEDSFVSTLGVVTGVASGTQDGRIVVLTGSVLVVVEAISMAAGSYLSSKSANEIQDKEKRSRRRRRTLTPASPLSAGFIMGSFYITGGLVPLFPYVFLKPSVAMVSSVALTCVALIGLGFFKARMTQSPVLKSCLEMTLISLGAAVVGYAVGALASMYLGVTL